VETTREHPELNPLRETFTPRTLPCPRASA
jgi:hypothetical protein